MNSTHDVVSTPIAHATSPVPGIPRNRELVEELGERFQLGPGTDLENYLARIHFARIRSARNRYLHMHFQRTQTVHNQVPSCFAWLAFDGTNGIRK
jgi:hypothetical protein